MTNGNSRSVLIKKPGMDPSATPPYYIVDDDFQSTSPTDSSEDSIDVVRIPKSPVLIAPSPSSSTTTTTTTTTTTSTGKRKYPQEEHLTIKDSIKSGPLKKRLCARTIIEQQTPFRPWNDVPKKTVPSSNIQRVVSTTCPRIVPSYEHDVPLSLVTKPLLEYNSSRSSSPLNLTVQSASAPLITPIPLHRLAPYLPPSIRQGPFSPMMPIPLAVTTPKGAYFRPPSPISEPVALIKKSLRVPVHPVPFVKTEDADIILAHTERQFPSLLQTNAEHPEAKFKPPVPKSISDIAIASSSSKKELQRNYKNMTRERRIEANARERTRVHTISAAFEALRNAVPAYSDTQKLSKLAVLRIACGYITTLSNLLEDSPDLAESVEAMTRMLEKEGNVKRKKDVDIDEDW